MEIGTKTLRNQISAADESNGAEGGASGQKEADHLAQTAVDKRLPDAAKINADKAVMELLEQDTEQEQEVQKEKEEKPSDSAEFSNDSLAYTKDIEDEDSRQRELELLLKELWMLLEGWQPQPDMDLLQEIMQLKEIYQRLLQEILKLYTQSQAGIQADRVNCLLLEIIDKMGNTSFPNLLCLLEKYGQNGVKDFLRASVLQKITGRAVSPQDLAAAREQQVTDETEMKQAFQTGQKRTSGGAFPEDGLLYYKGKGNRIAANQRYREWVREGEQFHLRSDSRNKRGDLGTGFFRLQRNTYSIADIMRAEKFLHYLNKKDDIFCSSDFTAKNEELMGFLMASAMTKVQIFAKHGGVGKEIAMDVQSALDRFFRHYLSKDMRILPLYHSSSQNAVQLDSKVVQRIYHQVLELIQRMKTPGKGLEKGLQYAWEVFSSKKANEEYKRYRRYQRNAGFFVSYLKDNDKIKELNYGSKLLDKDWEEFLESIDQSNNTLLQVMLTNSPWGMLLKPEGTPDGNIKTGAAGFLLLAGIGLFLLLVLRNLF